MVKQKGREELTIYIGAHQHCKRELDGRWSNSCVVHICMCIYHQTNASASRYSFIYRTEISLISIVRTALMRRVVIHRFKRRTNSPSHSPARRVASLNKPLLAFTHFSYTRRTQWNPREKAYNIKRLKYYPKSAFV